MDAPGAAEMVNEGLRGLLASGVITKAEAIGRVTPFSASSEPVKVKVLSPMVQEANPIELRLVAAQAGSAWARDGTSSAQQTEAIANKSRSFVIVPPLGLFG